ncbi:MAG: ceramidase [Elusimicrobia bacterium]|nr:ceramidase [Elusimicrobiota bacterium]
MTPPRPATALLLGIAAFAVIATFLHAPIPQDPAYHLFADTRALAGIPNFADVASNFIFLIAGVYGLSRRKRLAEPGGERAYTTLCAGVLLVSVGSAYYHLSPSNPTLVWDRLPMTVAFMAFFAMLLEERVLTGARPLAPLIVAGLASAVYWAWSDDLRPYLLVQFLPLMLMPVILVLYPRKYLSTRPLVAALVLYAAAKFFEVYDREVFSAAALSGHTVKHLLAGGASLCLISAVPAPLARVSRG